jgi:hypothetical protein
MPYGMATQRHVGGWLITLWIVLPSWELDLYPTKPKTRNNSKQVSLCQKALRPEELMIRISDSESPHALGTTTFRSKPVSPPDLSNKSRT